jgi:hypothetical protein
MDYVNILKYAYRQLCEGSSQSLLIRGTAKTVLLAAGLHVVGAINYSLGTTDLLFQRVEKLKRMEESNGITVTNQNSSR